MKTVRASQDTFAASGFFAFRTPALPFDDLLAWAAELEAPSAAGDAASLDHALSADRSTLRVRLAAIVGRASVREAIFVASPSLDESVDHWLRDPHGDRGQRAERALVRYVSRMAGRATPFGLFAGCGVGTVGGETRLALAGREGARRHTRLDMDYLFSLVETLSRDPAVRRSLVYRPNSSLYQAGGRVRYVEARLDGKHRSQHLVSMEATEALDATLERARDGATLETLATALADDGVTVADAERFVHELIDSQVLVSDLALPVTGGSPIDVLIDDLNAHGGCQSAGVLVEARRLLADFDSTGLDLPPERYRAAARALEALPVKPDLDRLFQVDLTVGAKTATLGSMVVDEIAAGIDILRRVARPREQEVLQRFRDAFVDRYEHREVRLVEVLDEEVGIGFGTATETSPLLQNLTFPAAAEEAIPWTDRDSILLSKLADALASGHQEIRLEHDDIEKLAATEPLPLPDAFCVVGAVAASDETALATGRFLVRLDGLDGPSGAQLLGRFCHADHVLRERVERHLRAEEALEPDAVFAEIVHLPEGRLGNILYRPILRSLEIPYLGRSSVPPERQIPLSDLMVSVAAGEIVLRSASLNRRIVPRLTTAHNFSWRSLGVYRFLCALQSQGVAHGLGWDWGPLAHAPFLPRIVTGRLVLSRARWLVRKQELKRFDSTGRALFDAICDWRVKRRLPRWVLLADGDNTLPVDLDNVLSVESFAHLVKERDEAVLLELFPDPDRLSARGPDGRFVHELVIPFVSRESVAVKRHANSAVQPERARPFARRESRRPAGERSFPPGSEWLFVKLYCGTATADDVVREVIAPVARTAVDAGTTDRWFFIRYHDPASHVRVRFHGERQVLQHALWPALQEAAAPLLGDSRIWRVVLDTYQPEIERYGGPEAIVLAERLFQSDSEAVVDIIGLLDRGDAGLDERWRLALVGMDRLVADFGFDADAKLALFKAARTAFAREFRSNRAVERQLGDKFRKERSGLGDLLNEPRDGNDGSLAPGLEILRERSARMRPAIDELKAHDKAGQLTASCREIVPSLLHMHANRLLRSAQRAQELVLHDFLARHYESRLAQMKRMGHFAEVAAATEEGAAGMQ